MKQRQGAEDDVVLAVAEPIRDGGAHVGGAEVREDRPLGPSRGTRRAMIQVMMTGAGQVILERFTPDGVLQAIQQHRITLFPGVPTMFNYLVNFPDRAKYDLTSLRIAKSAGAVLPAKLMHDFETLYGVPLVDGYGSRKRTRS